MMLRLVFSEPAYAAMAAAVFAAMLVPMLAVSGFVFFEPYVVGHVPPGSEANLASIVALAGVSAVVIPMNVYGLRARAGRPGGFFGSAFGAAAGACGCGPAGFALVSALGPAGAAASAFLANYETPLRAAAIGVLLASWWMSARSIRAACRVDGKLTRGQKI